MLVFINQVIEYRSSEVMLQLQNISVRQLDYCVHFWSHTWLWSDSTWKGTEIHQDIASYEESLEKLSWFSLTQKKLRGHMIDMHKITRGIKQKIFIHIKSRIRRGYKGHIHHTEWLAPRKHAWEWLKLGCW